MSDERARAQTLPARRAQQCAQRLRRRELRPGWLLLPDRKPALSAILDQSSGSGYLQRRLRLDPASATLPVWNGGCVLGARHLPPRENAGFVSQQQHRWSRSGRPLRRAEVVARRGTLGAIGVSACCGVGGLTAGRQRVRPANRRGRDAGAGLVIARQLCGPVFGCIRRWSPTRTIPGWQTRAPTASRAPRSTAIVPSTSRSRSIPSGCGRVTITQRWIL